MRLSIKYKRIVFLLMGIWLFLMMAVPSISLEIKMTSLFLFLGAYSLDNNIRIRRTIFLALVFWQIYFLFTFINAFANGFRFDWTLFEIYIIRPVIFVIFTSLLKKKKDIELLANLLVILSFFIGVYNLVFFIQSIGIIPEFISEEKLFGARSIVITSNTFFTYRTSNQTAIMFLMPYMCCYCRDGSFFLNKKRRVVFVVALLLVFVSLTSGRRILQFECIIVLTMMIIQSVKILKIRIKKCHFFMATALLIGITVFLFLSNSYIGFNLVNALFNTLKDAFVGRIGEKDYRGEMVKSLFAMWKNNPIIGWGISAYDHSYNSWRGSGETWSYEYFYLALLSQIGALGIILVSIYIFKLFRELFVFSKKRINNLEAIIIRSILWGFLGFLFCGATNPLATSSWMWFIVIWCYDYCVRNRKYKLNLSECVGRE